MTMDAEEVAALKVYGLLAAGGLVIVTAGSWMHYKHSPPALREEERPKAEKKPEARSALGLTFTPDGYKAILAEDERKFGVGATYAMLQDPFPLKVEFQGARRFSTGEVFATEHLEIGSRVEREWMQLSGNQGFGTDQFLLTIKNKSPHYLAYHVQTEVPEPRACRSMGAVPHNAVALRPGEQLTRAECLWTRGFSVVLRRVEVMEIPSLSYYYLSRLHPAHALYEQRTSQGHQPPIGKPCELVPWRDIQSGAEAGEVKWADVMDFYGRHNCDEYMFFRGYVRRSRRDAPLPALPPGPADRPGK